MKEVEYLLISLQEELAEMQQAISKALRFGLDDIYEGKNNLQYIQKEYTDVQAVIETLEDIGVDVFTEDADEFLKDVEDKVKCIKKWMKYSKDCRVLDYNEE